jgi:hypothetical protein
VLTYNVYSGKMNVVARTDMDLPGVGQIEKMGNGRDGFASFGVALNETGPILFPAKVEGNEALILAAP